MGDGVLRRGFCRGSAENSSVDETNLSIVLNRPNVEAEILAYLLRRNLPESEVVRRTGCSPAFIQEVLRRHNRRVETSFLGRAGESWVASRLFRMGLNLASFSVDLGIDLVAQDPFDPFGQPVHVQVKTTSRETASVPIRAVQRAIESTINLVIVFWPSSGEPQALVLPPSLLTALILGGPLEGRRTLRAAIKEGRATVSSGTDDLSLMINRFELLESTDVDASDPCAYYFPGFEPPIDIIRAYQIFFGAGE